VAEGKPQEREMGICSSHPQLPVDAEFVEEREFLDGCKTGDIILWCGEGIDSDIVRCASSSLRWSHISMVYRDMNNRLFLFESNKGLHPRDHFTGKHKDGVRLSNLSYKLHHYKGFFVASRKLHCTPKQRSEIAMKLERIIEETIPESYSETLYEMANSVLDGNTFDLPGFTCIELVAYTSIQLGIVKPGKRPNNYTLTEFTSENWYLPYERKDIYWEEEVYCYTPRFLGTNKRKKPKRKLPSTSNQGLYFM
jgi:hypothetical protein